MKKILNNKKGLAIKKVIQIFLIVVGIVIVLYIVLQILVMLGIVSLDDLCSFGSSIRSASNIFEPVGIDVYFWPQMCERQDADVSSDKWDECPACKARAQNATTTKETYDAMRDCAMQQVAELVRRCWDTRGSGALDPGSTDCFQFSLVDYPEDVNINLKWADILNFMHENNVSGTDTPYFDVITTNIIVSGTIKRDEIWMIRYEDIEWKPGPGWAEDVTGADWLEWDRGGDYITIKKAHGVKVIPLPGGCTRWPPCDKTCSFSLGYTNDTETCYADPYCKVLCDIKDENETD